MIIIHLNKPKKNVEVNSIWFHINILSTRQDINACHINISVY